jgi:exodeoxyribonuclease V gamma subunit
MAGLHIYASNRMEILAEQLAQIIRIPLQSPLAAEIIVVQSRGMERWISMELADLNGISANCTFPFPNAFLENIFKKIKPDLPDTSLFHPAVLTFRLMRIIPNCLGQKGFENLRSYLADDDNQLKLFQLSGKIADLFDQYLVFRPELIFEWEAKKEKIKTPHMWQAKLWRELVGEIGTWHRARLRKELFQRIERLKIEPLDLPARVSIFGISYMPLFHLQALAALSRLAQINFFILNPCQEYWADIVSEREIKRIRQKNSRVAENMEWYHFEKGNRLLAAMGTQGRNFFDMITGFDCEFHEKFQEPDEVNILAGLQSDILNLRDRDGADSASPDNFENLSSDSAVENNYISNKDTSLQIHSCHSPMREIEILHDNLLAMFEEDPGLSPKDIIVMTPDIETYAPLVQAVFDSQTDETLRIPFSIADQSPRRENRMIDGFLALLDFADSRFGVLQVVGLLEFSGIKERFGLVESDLKIIERWIKDTRIRWGIDKNSRLEADLPGFSENTWRSGLDRLILGYAMPGENRTMFNGILPYDNIEGSEAQILGRFLEFFDRLVDWATTLVKPRKLVDWHKTLTALIDQFFQPDENTERELQLLRQILAELASREIDANYPDDIELQVIQAYLRSQLEQNNFGAGFLTGGVTFCAMLPMRSIPFKIICLIGLDNAAFPRDFQPLNFDLMAQNPQTGDRSRRNDDKYLFLESLISARSIFYISYVGQSIQDNSQIPPSVLVSELIDTIADRFNRSNPPIVEQIVTYHRLQQFSAAYFHADSELFSYSTENMLACAGAKEPRKPGPFFNRRMPVTAAESDISDKVDLDSLCLFFSNPTRYLIQRRLGIRLEDEDILSDDEENFVLQSLERYLVEQGLLQNLASGVSLDDYKPIQAAIGQLPHGHVGDYYLAEMAVEAQNFVRQTETYTSAATLAPVEIDFEAAGFDVSGRLVSVSALGCIHIRYARLRVRDLLRAWIYHLIYCHTAPPDYEAGSYLICRDSTVYFEPLSDSLASVETLLQVYRQGLEIPIHFFPESSFEYSEQLLRKAQPKSMALQRAGGKWVGSEYYNYTNGESADPYYDLCFRHLDPLDDEFHRIALIVFEPLLAHSRTIPL